MNNLPPNYKLIYEDMIAKKYAHKKADCSSILNKSTLSVMDVIKINKIISDNSDEATSVFNQKLRSYDKSTVLEILDYQKINKLNNKQAAIKFKTSRNTISKWKKMFSEKN